MTLIWNHFLVDNQELRDNLQEGLEEFWVNVLAPYQSLVCPPSEQFIFTASTFANTRISWCIFSSKSLIKKYENGFQLWKALFTLLQPGENPLIFLLLPPPPNKGALPDTPFFISFPLSLVLQLLQDCPQSWLPCCSMGIMDSFLDVNLSMYVNTYLHPCITIDHMTYAGIFILFYFICIVASKLTISKDVLGIDSSSIPPSIFPGKGCSKR